MNPQIHPYRLRMLKTRILVHKYRRPDSTAGGLVIPESYRDDKDNWKHWELAAPSDSLNEHLGFEVPEGSILVIRGSVPPTDMSVDDERNGRGLFTLPAEWVCAVPWMPA